MNYCTLTIITLGMYYISDDDMIFCWSQNDEKFGCRERSE